MNSGRYQQTSLYGQYAVVKYIEKETVSRVDRQPLQAEVHVDVRANLKLLLLVWL
jgi:hypothetical protein